MQSQSTTTSTSNPSATPSNPPPEGGRSKKGPESEKTSKSKKKSNEATAARQRDDQETREDDRQEDDIEDRREEQRRKEDTFVTKDDFNDLKKQLAEFMRQHSSQRPTEAREAKRPRSQSRSPTVISDSDSDTEDIEQESVLELSKLLSRRNPEMVIRDLKVEPLVDKMKLEKASFTTIVQMDALIQEALNLLPDPMAVQMLEHAKKIAAKRTSFIQIADKYGIKTAILYEKLYGKKYDGETLKLAVEISKSSAPRTPFKPQSGSHRKVGHHNQRYETQERRSKPSPID